MVNIFKINILNLIIIFFIGCSSQSISNQERIETNYNQGIEFYNKGKYSKAKESFKYVILNALGSRLALESEFYLSESLYELGEYEEALYGYDNYARSSQDLELIEHARFKLCQCAFNLTVDYKKDQFATMDALEKIAIFLEDYPASKYYSETILIKSELIYRLAKKEYESAILYIKLQEYKSALIYLFEILNNYIPLESSSQNSSNQSNEYNEQLKKISDNAKIMIIYSYLFDDKSDMANKFYNAQINNFYVSEAKEKASSLLSSNNLSRLDIWRDILLGIF
tara:strand:+ start:1784 stop:2632 length:849 start_codon:yes stop_codon:yes gene_type:complete